MTNKTLAQIYIEHKGKVSDKWQLYLEEYDRVFSAYRTKPIRMLEIGIQNGGSLEIWSKYFPNGKKFIGCDVNPDCSRLRYDDSRIAVVTGNANSDSTQGAILQHSPEFDIVIDDGSHLSGDIVKSFAKYFPKIIDGGIFVAEDLHCSYWREFEGGLYDQFSSIAFFKRLADIVNHEHWGLGKARCELLKSFLKHYQFELDEEILEHIHSIEFINSMCVVSKSSLDNNLLGDRVVAGKIEEVVPGHAKLSGSSCEALDQEKYSSNSEEMPIEDRQIVLLRNIERLNEQVADLNLVVAERDKQIVNLNQAVTERDNQISTFLGSISWRITRPVRLVGSLFIKCKTIFRIIPDALKLKGSIWHLYKIFLTTLKDEGWSGVKYKLVTLNNQITNDFDRNDYAEWIIRYDSLTDEKRVYMSSCIEELSLKPLISVVMPTYNPRPEWLTKAIESVQKQIYPHWELCIADDLSTDPGIHDLLEKFSRDDERIKIVFREKNEHISAASNSALELATGEWVALMDHDDLLPEDALFWVADAINRKPYAHMIYSDEDKIDDSDNRHSPYFKCDWNTDLFYSQNMFCHLGVYKRQLIEDVNGFRLGLEGAQDYDLVLRCIEKISLDQIHHIPRVLYHWRTHSGSTAQSADAKPYAKLAAERALNEHFERVGVGASVVSTQYGFRAQYSLPENPPLVSLIIPTRNGLKILRQCIDSIITKTTYPNYEIIVVDNASDDPRVLTYFDTITSEHRVKVLKDDRPFNYSQLNNAAVEIAKGEIIGLINNDIEVITPEWLSEMVSHALRPGVGAVGAKLLYPYNTIQHAGVVLGLGGVAGHSHKHFPRESNGYYMRLRLISEYSAVTAACLVIKKSIYNKVGGLNERDLKVAFNDVDFCLRVREAGYRNIWTPYAELYHHESVSRGYEDTPEKKKRFESEVSYMREHWVDLLENDPAYSPNLTQDSENFSLAFPPRVTRYEQ